MKTARELIVEFTLERLEAEPLRKRIEMLRALAVLAPGKLEATRLHAAADELEKAERSHEQLVLDFKRRAL